MSIPSECLARLNNPALGDAKFRTLGLAVNLAALKGVPPKALPAGFIFMAGEEAEENARATGPVLQLVHGLVTLLIIADDKSDARGAAAGDQVEALKAEARRRLIGFVPAGAEGPMEFDAGEAVDFAANCVWWEERYAVDFYIEEAQA